MDRPWLPLCAHHQPPTAPWTTSAHPARGLAPPGSPCTRPGGHARPWNGGRPSPQAGAGDVSAEVALRSACAALERGERGRSTRSVSAHGHGPDAHVSGTAAGEDPSSQDLLRSAVNFFPKRGALTRKCALGAEEPCAKLSFLRSRKTKVTAASSTQSEQP
ncbi:unnamed protein product [Rangifer tarandus platyrhynchus]|uniref:Uncharacterized protein n=1 Tax=Rangifer tarandus platyrhynchus TaxID=3082113 RepID=A0AC59Y451_RANTA